MASESTYYEVMQKPDGFGRIAKSDLASLARIIQDRYDVWLDRTRGMRNQWRLNGLFSRGFQWSAINTATQRVVLPPVPKNRRYVIINVIKPWALDTEAKLDIDAPAFDVTPNTLSQEDKDASIAAEGVGMHYWRSLDIRENYRTIVRNCTHFGSALGESVWDKTIGPRFRIQAEGQAEEILTLGDLRFKVFEPWNWFCDEITGNLDDKSYVSLLSWMSIDAINNFWPDGDLESGERVDDEHLQQPMDDVAQVLTQAHGSGVDSQSSDHRTKGAIVFKWFMKPQHAAEKGLVVFMAQNKILQVDVWPDEYARLDGYPLQDYHWYRHPNQFRGTSPMEDQIGLQREINKTASQIRENMDSMLALKWMNPTGSGVQTIDEMAGQIINYNAGFMPTISQSTPIPAHAFRYLSDLFVMMEDIQMLHKPSKGKVPPGVKSGVGIELLQEQDDRPLSIPESSLHVSLTKQFRKILQIVSVAVEDERMIAISGPNRRRQVQAFKGADLKSNTDIHLSVVGGSSKSKPAIVRKVLDMVQVGMFRDEATGQLDTRRIMEMIRFAIPDVLYQQEDKHEELAYAENDLLWQEGPPPLPQQWEEHFLHLRVHEEDMNSLKWKQQAQENPEWGTRWIAHREGHLQFIIQSTPTAVGDQAQANGSAQAAPTPA